MAVFSLPANKWTKVADPDFGSVNIHPQGNVTLMYAFSAGAPADADTSSGGILSMDAAQSTVGTTDIAAGLYLRPALPNISSMVRVV